MSKKDIPNSNRKMLTTGELASFLHVHINTVRRWSNSGIIDSYRIGPRRDRRFDENAVARFIQNGHDLYKRNS